jgi:hypothetical protein
VAIGRVVGRIVGLLEQKAKEGSSPAPLYVTLLERTSMCLRGKSQALRWRPAAPESRTPAIGYSQGFRDRASTSQLLVVPVLSNAGSLSPSQRHPIMLMTHRARPPVPWAVTEFRSRQTMVAPHHLIRHRSLMPFGTAPWLDSGRLRSWKSPILWVDPGAADLRADVSSP